VRLRGRAERPDSITQEIGRQVEYRPVETDGAKRAATLVAERLN
jgi:hypothetical protein